MAILLAVWLIALVWGVCAAGYLMAGVVGAIAAPFVVVGVGAGLGVAWGRFLDWWDEAPDGVVVALVVALVIAAVWAGASALGIVLAVAS